MIINQFVLGQGSGKGILINNVRVYKITYDFACCYCDTAFLPTGKYFFSKNASCYGDQLPHPP